MRWKIPVFFLFSPVLGRGISPFSPLGSTSDPKLIIALPEPFNVTFYLFLLERVEVIMSSKEIDSENTTWKGAAVMAHLESAFELWIHAHEWEKHGARLLREKSVFIW